MASTLFDKIWDSHAIGVEGDRTLLYIDCHLIHEVTSPQAFDGLRLSGRKIRSPERVVAVIDHNIPTINQMGTIEDPLSRIQVETMRKNSNEFGINLFDVGDDRNGIVHVVGPEQGRTLPGSTVVCGDSHTATHGAFGCLAFGIGTSEVEHVMATQSLLQKRPKTMRININGALQTGVYAKDIILGLIGKVGIGGGTGYVFEYAGSTITGLSMAERMTICNMSIEAGARAGMIAPDDTTYEYLANKPGAPKGGHWEAALKWWKTLPSDADAIFDAEIDLDASSLAPQVTWGTNPEMVLPVTELVPDPNKAKNSSQAEAWTRALTYMGLTPNTPLTDIRINKVFIGSCTNSRIEDLRVAAQYAKGRKVADNVQALVVPGSGLVRKQAMAEGLDRIFVEAGFEWREPGCSMCLGMNTDVIGVGDRCASTSNRNFEGRQGAGSRTHLMSPAMAAAAAVNGHIVNTSSL